MNEILTKTDLSSNAENAVKITPNYNKFSFKPQNTIFSY